jgi:hypothetical protein
LFDEYTRRQFLAKAPEKNPFGTAEMPAKFAEFDVLNKVCRFTLRDVRCRFIVHTDESPYPDSRVTADDPVDHDESRKAARED